MSRPLGLETDSIVDASVLAYAHGDVERHFTASQLPRLAEASIVEPAEIRILLRPAIVDGRVALSGELSGSVTMTCQRCMQPVAVDLVDEFQLVIVSDEAERVALEDSESGYEPIVADAARFDMRWLAEEQTLLSVPLVPKHEDEACATWTVSSIESPEPSDGGVTQRPFANLKDLLRER
jgi:uncharacterized protein